MASRYLKNNKTFENNENLSWGNYCALLFFIPNYLAEATCAVFKIGRYNKN